jgi:hypothetical protein
MSASGHTRGTCQCISVIAHSVRAESRVDSSPGIQEFIEAVSLLHYLRHSTLITLAEVHERLRESSSDPTPVRKVARCPRFQTDANPGRQIVPISAEDYALGVSDLTGELMRYATNCEHFLSHSRPITKLTDFQAQAPGTTRQRSTPARS